MITQKQRQHYQGSKAEIREQCPSVIQYNLEEALQLGQGWRAGEEIRLQLYVGKILQSKDVPKEGRR